MKYNAQTPIRRADESSFSENSSSKYFQIPGINTETFWIIDRVLDGDSLIVKEEFGQEAKEIRLYGLDAPEVYLSRKMREDEAKSHIPASLLLQYGLMSLNYVLQVAPPGTKITLVTEKKNQLDFWLRQLAYVILPSGECLNELLITNGWAKASHSYYCSMLPEYQTLNFQAKQQKLGIYLFIEVF
ncbi:thermonuclease family protein [Kaistella palustris]|uniref:thermonuclease family protein n=1 Tax=Kaistella palustris TaxID=493376 RepID=UPI000426CEEE|nr:thermonuclease family protein [Kaistella palustris]